jgi:hypothetical protein
MVTAMIYDALLKEARKHIEKTYCEEPDDYYTDEQIIHIVLRSYVAFIREGE